MESNKDQNQTNDEQPETLYVDINPENPVTEIESLCMNCELQGVTKIMMTKIPFFKEIILMAFECPHCGYRSSEVNHGQTLADHGIHFELNVNTQRDLNRKLIKSEYATINIPNIGLEIPPKTQKAKLTTIEGYLSVAKDQFENAINEGIYDELEEDTRNKIKELVVKLSDVLELKSLPIRVILDDPSGNSFIENPYAPQSDPYIKVSYYERTKEMSDSMGYSYTPKINEEDANKEEITGKEFVKPNYYSKNKEFTIYKSKSEISAHLVDFTRSIQESSSIKDEALSFQTNCYCCYAPGEAYMCICTIPYFKEIIISCFKCQICGYKTTEVRGGGGISEKATIYTLQVKDSLDLNRDLFKSETAQIKIPEIGFETDTGSMGSMFTTVEGLIDQIASNLNNIPFSKGDSSDDGIGRAVEKLKLLVINNSPFTLIIDDPLSNSFISSLVDPESDTRLTKEEYERSWEQNEDLGINDMKVENYAEETDN